MSRGFAAVVLAGGVLVGLASGILPAFAQATASPSPVSPQVTKDERQAQRALETLRQARPKGLGQPYFDAATTYYQRLQRLFATIEKAPDVMAADREISEAKTSFNATLASPAATALDIAQSHARLADMQEARSNLVAAKKAEILTRLNLLPIDSPDLFAANQTEFIDFFSEPNPGAHGPVTTYYPEAPWQVELQWAGFENHQPAFSPEELHACGGALIAPDWVLTAAHCVWDRKTSAAMPTSALQARGGAKALADLSPPIPIAEIRVHPDYRVSSLTSPATADIALVRLSRPMDLSHPDRQSLIPFARAGYVPPRTPEAATASGWGATEELSFADQVHRISVNGRLKMSPELRIVPQMVFGQSECAQVIRDRVYAGNAKPPPPAPVHPGNLCAGGGSGTCQGDSGGPLVAHSNMHYVRRAWGDEPVVRGTDHPMVFGVVSWGAGCQYFTVFTRVSAYADWIDQTINPRRK